MGPARFETRPRSGRTTDPQKILKIILVRSISTTTPPGALGRPEESLGAPRGLWEAPRGPCGPPEAPGGPGGPWGHRADGVSQRTCSQYISSIIFCGIVGACCKENMYVRTTHALHSCPPICLESTTQAVQHCRGNLGAFDTQGVCVYERYGKSRQTLKSSGSIK